MKTISVLFNMRYSILPAFLLFTVMAATEASAQTKSLHVPKDSAQICALMREFVEATKDKPISLDLPQRYAMGDFATMLQKQTGKQFWTVGMKSCTFRDVRSIRRNDSAVVVRYVVSGDSIPYSGPLAIDWCFFLHRNDSAQWRIYAVRTLKGIDEGVGELILLSQSKDYPASLKPMIAREIEPIIWSNARLREHFTGYRSVFQQLAEQFRRKKDPLIMLGRIDRKINQLNGGTVNWESGAHEIPQAAIDEFMQTATDEQKQEMQIQLKHAAELRKSGDQAILRFANKYRINPKRLDTLVSMMHDTRVSFITNKLPWKGSVQLTVAGSFDNAVGFLYSPSGELPLLSSEEYFDLEELGDGWWIFRAT